MASAAAQQAVAAVAAAQAKDTAIAVRLVFLRAAYDKLLAERDGRKNKALSEAVHNVAGACVGRCRRRRVCRVPD